MIKFKKKKSPASNNVFLYSLWVFQVPWLCPVGLQNSKVQNKTNSKLSAKYPQIKIPILILYSSVEAGGDLSGRGSKLTGRMAWPSGMLSWTITYPVNWPKQLLTECYQQARGWPWNTRASFALRFHPWERYYVSFLPGHPPYPLTGTRAGLWGSKIPSLTQSSLHSKAVFLCVLWQAGKQSTTWLHLFSYIWSLLLLCQPKYLYRFSVDSIPSSPQPPSFPF